MYNSQPGLYEGKCFSIDKLDTTGWVSKSTGKSKYQ